MNVRALALLLALAAPSWLAAAGTGLIAELRPADGPADAAVRRLDAALQFDWTGASADPRLAPGPFVARWRGRLRLGDDGAFRFAADLAGHVAVRVGDRVVLEGSSVERGWIEGPPSELEFGYAPIEIEYRSPSRATAPRRLRLFWDGPEFELEPIPTAALSPGESAQLDAADSEFSRGHALVRRLHCAACHEIPAVRSGSRVGPSLQLAGRHLDPVYFKQRLLDPAAAAAGARMPDPGLSSSEADAVIAYLRSVADTPRAAPSLSKRQREELRASRGERWIQSRGCLACHSLHGRGRATLDGGRPLDDAGTHRSLEVLVRWLAPADSADDDAAHHAPRLPLTPQERWEVALFLRGDGEASTRDARGAESHEADAEQIARGRRLVQKHRCGACHELPGESRPPETAALPTVSREEFASGCAATPSRDGQPRYALSESQQQAIATFLARVHPRARLDAAEEGRLLFAEKGCGNCHRRGEHEGLAPVIADLAAQEASYRGREGALRPPFLGSVGGKLIDRLLEASIAGEQDVRRPWLEVRMPRYRHSERERDALVAFLKLEDRLPEGVTASTRESREPANDGELFAAGHQLVGPAGFNCTSCHDFAEFSPEGVAPNVRGPDLVQLESRLRKSWFLRWMPDPTRMAPGVEMPAISVAFPGVLDDDRDRQIEAMWFALNSPHFTTPAHGATVREVSAVGSDRAHAVHDVFKLHGPFGDGWRARSLAAGLPGGCNVLYDLDRMAPIAWWTGTLARQVTQGKTWYWQVGGTPLVGRLPAVPLAGLRVDGKLELPRRIETTVGWLESWSTPQEEDSEAAGSFALTARLHFGGERWLRVREVIESIGEEPSQGGASVHPRGMQRTLEVIEPRNAARLEAEEILSLAGLPLAAIATASERDIRIETVQGPARIVAAGDGASWKREDGMFGDGVAVFSQPLTLRDGRRMARQVLRLEADTTVVANPVAPPVLRRERRELTHVPGYRVTRLPLDERVMPTAFAFDREGGVYFTSLNGQVRKLIDIDGDGSEDRAVVVAESLSAPYGILVDGQDLVVTTKPELVRLQDASADGYFERADVLATGWGFSHDYHDWTVGLLERGGDYIAVLGSDYQQKGRPQNTTMFRGKLVRISPQGQVDAVARGFRFACGIAANAEGDIFVTDNQGVGNTFNEINHVRAGKAYGVPSLYDPAQDRKRRGELPAVQLPHPWTRSVNGICFLDSGKANSPFAGHGLGAEYDNHAVIRFSLQKVGDTYQGAAYPFSRSRKGAGGFLGPIAIAQAPRGTIYLGNLRDSGWGGGNNVGSVCRLERDGALPPGIAEIAAWSRGFDIRFTSEVDAQKAAEPASYAITAYQRIWKGGYATPDRDRHEVSVERAHVARDRRSVRLEVAPLQTGFVFDLHVRAIGETDEPLWPADGHYTLNALPDS